MPAQGRAKTEKAATREQDGEHQKRPEYHLPVFGNAGEPLLDDKIDGGADNGAVQRAEAAENDHHDQFAGLLPRHVGRAYEFSRVGEQKSGQAAESAGDDVGDELKAANSEADSRHPGRVLLAAAQHAAETRGDERAAKQISREQANKRDVIKRA